MFPESATHRKERVVLDDDLGVAANFANARSLKLARDLPRVPVQLVAHNRNGGRLFLEKHPSRYCLHIRVGERHANREPVHELLEEWHARQSTLASSDEHYLAVEFLGDSLRNLGEQHRAVVRVANVLLRLVENEDGAREPSVPSSLAERLLGDAEEISRGDIGVALGKLLSNRLARLDLVRGELGIARQ